MVGTYHIELILRQHVILGSVEDGAWNRVDVLQIGLDQERRVESNGNINLGWRVVIGQKEGLRCYSAYLQFIQ